MQHPPLQPCKEGFVQQSIPGLGEDGESTKQMWNKNYSPSPESREEVPWNQHMLINSLCTLWDKKSKLKAQAHGIFQSALLQHEPKWFITFSLQHLGLVRATSLNLVCVPTTQRLPRPHIPHSHCFPRNIQLLLKWALPALLRCKGGKAFLPVLNSTGWNPRTDSNPNKKN